MKKTLFLLSLLAFGLTGCQYQGTVPENPQSVVPENSQGKIEIVSRLIHEMPKNGMDQVKSLIPDLVFVKDVPKDSSENISDGMGDESWMYSPSLDTTIVVCKMINTPAHVFRGKSMTAAELEGAKKIMKKMMGGNGHGDKSMDMEDMDMEDMGKMDMMGKMMNMMKKMMNMMGGNGHGDKSMDMGKMKK